MHTRLVENPQSEKGAEKKKKKGERGSAAGGPDYRFTAVRRRAHLEYPLPVAALWGGFFFFYFNFG